MRHLCGVFLHAMCVGVFVCVSVCVCVCVGGGGGGGRSILTTIGGRMHGDVHTCSHSLK